jgi:hypothetical protein
MAITERKLEDQNPSQAPTLGMGAGTFGQQAQQRTNIAQGGSGRFTNLQQYIKANEANPNAQLLQREGTRRQEELGTRQQEFTKQAEPIKQQFEGIRSGQQFVQSALQDPTKIVQDPKNIERFSQYRTQGIGDVEAPFQQLQSARGTLGTQQEQLASGLETIQRDPNALQNFIQSQRVNPALATRGENVLDRFLTQSTESGQKAIAGLGATAGAIRGTQAPSIIQDVESLRTQAQGGPLASSDVMNLLSGAVKPEEEFIRGINPEQAKNYIASSLNGNAQSFDENLNELNRNIRKIQQTIAQRDRNIAEFRAEYNPGRKQQEYNDLESSIIADPRSANDNWVRQQRAEGARRIEDKYNINRADLGSYEGERYINEITNNPEAQKLRAYESAVNNLQNLNRQELLQQYDPTRLSRIQALQQLTGSTPFTPLLQGRIS